MNELAPALRNREGKMGDAGLAAECLLSLFGVDPETEEDRARALAGAVWLSSAINEIWTGLRSQGNTNGT